MSATKDDVSKKTVIWFFVLFLVFHVDFSFLFALKHVFKITLVN